MGNSPSGITPMAAFEKSRGCLRPDEDGPPTLRMVAPGQLLKDANPVHTRPPTDPCRRIPGPILLPKEPPKACPDGLFTAKMTQSTTKKFAS